MDNVLIARLWRSLKYEDLRQWTTKRGGRESKDRKNWTHFYNRQRKHQALGYTTPWSHYRPEVEEPKWQNSNKQRPPKLNEAWAA